MQARMRAFNEAWRSEGIPQLQMRIGLHQGTWLNRREFWVGQRSDYTAIGPAVNLASRVETVAKPGTIFCTEAVHLHLGELSSRSARLHEFKGVKEEQELYIIDFLKDDVYRRIKSNALLQGLVRPHQDMADLILW